MTPADPANSPTDGERYSAALTALGFPVEAGLASPPDLARLLLEATEVRVRNEETVDGRIALPALPDLTGPDGGQVVLERLIMSHYRAIRLAHGVTPLGTAMREAVGEGGVGEIWRLAAETAQALEATLAFLISVSVPEVDTAAAGKQLRLATDRLAAAGETAAQIRATAPNEG
ncbi:hypothetical protein [Streptomyces hainanensis]|uniref:Uncharacterized protein n=1 Tax=Streptomyces hainanensis TaxID=402648 RepID=A0A4R4SL94_9ACTN|nr:hypothetical protein [Streptomyces hainanensis]TDC64418.1 hypothetical protein E1283_31555 [Streptomyces hainanensis]